MSSRKVTKWVDITPDREWQAKLECGHAIGLRYEGDSGFTDEEKEATEQGGNTVICYECVRHEELIARLEQQLSEAKKAAEACRQRESKGE